MCVSDAGATRACWRDVLGFSRVDTGRGWLIFSLPPAELAAHPTDDEGRHEFYLMPDDIELAIAGLECKSVEFTLYQPRRPTALPRSAAPGRTEE